MTKILHLLTERDTDIGNHLLTLLPAYSSCYTPQVLLPNNSPLLYLLENAGIPVDTYTEIRRVKNHIRQLRPDILHTHSFIADRVTGKYGRVHTQHTLPDIGRFARLLYGLGDRVIATTNAVQDNLSAMGVPDIRLVYDGTDIVQHYSQQQVMQLRQKLDIPQDYFVVLFLGTLTPEFEFVLESAREMPYNVILLVTNASHEMREQAKKLRNVRFIDCDHSLILSITNVQLCCHNTQDQILPQLLAGMSARIPTICNNFDRYIVQDKQNGLVVPANDAQALDDAITMLKDDDALYKTLSERAWSYYSTRFTTQKMVDETEKTYRELIK